MSSAVNAEFAVLGAPFIDPSVVDKLAEIVTPADFEDPQRAEVWASIVELADGRNGISAVTVASHIMSRRSGALRRGLLESDQEVLEFVLAAGDNVLTAVGSEWHAEIVSGAAKLRSDVELQAAMLAELTRENAERGRALGGKNDAANVYALHNLGEGDGAKFLKSLSANPGMSVRDALMRGVTTEKGRKRVESVIANNRSLYGDGSISVGDAYSAMGKKMSAGARYAEEARAVTVRSPVSVSMPAPAAGGMPSVPSIPDAPRVAVPLGSNANAKPAVVVVKREDAGRDVSDRGIAHVATGGLASILAADLPLIEKVEPELTLYGLRWAASQHRLSAA